MSSRGWWLLLCGGVVLMAAASVWAPAQPELVSGGSCNVALCGALEDPARWRTAWWLWGAGAVVSLSATAVGVRPSRAPRWPVLLAGVVVVPALLVAVAVAAMVVSLVTSVQGAATVAVVCVLLPTVGAVTSWVKGSRRGARCPTPVAGCPRGPR